MFLTNSDNKSGELLGQERRRRWSPEQKLTMVRESLEPGQRVLIGGQRGRRRGAGLRAVRCAQTDP